MKFFILLSLFLFGFVANATTNQYGDLLNGSSSSPTAGTVVVDSGALSMIGSNHDFYDVTFIASCTLACTLEYGVFDNSNNPVRTFTALVAAGVTMPIRLPHIPMVNNEKLRIRVSSLNLGVVSGAIGLQLMNSD